MKKLIFTILFLQLTWISIAQSLFITNVQVIPVANGVQVNLKTISFNGADFLSSNYVVDGNEITLNACYSFNGTLPVLTFDNTFFIPIDSDYDSYTIDVNAYNSAAQDVCDYHSLAGTYSTTFMETTDLNIRNQFTIAPNPTDGLLKFNTDVYQFKNIGIYDFLGRQVFYSSEFHPEINLQNYNDGIYTIRLENENGSTSKKIILKK